MHLSRIKLWLGKLNLLRKRLVRQEKPHEHAVINMCFRMMQVNYAKSSAVLISNLGCLGNANMHLYFRVCSGNQNCFALTSACVKKQTKTIWFGSTHGSVEFTHWQKQQNLSITAGGKHGKWKRRKVKVQWACCARLCPVAVNFPNATNSQATHNECNIGILKHTLVQPLISWISRFESSIRRTFMQCIRITIDVCMHLYS